MPSENPDATPEPTEPAASAEPHDDRPEPEEHLLVDPRQVRRAPRYGAFLTMGAVVGLAAGLIFGTWLVGQVDPSQGDSPLEKPGVYVTVIMASTTTLGLLVSGLLAILADRRSLRRR